MILLGHPTGNPNSHHAALAHFEHHRLAAFVVPWMPSDTTLRLVSAIPGLRQMASRLGRRRFEALERAPLIQDRIGEMRRLFLRLIGRGDEGLAYEANDWLMHTMAVACRASAVTAVHAYEDAAAGAFVAARRLAKACIYDLPIGYHPAWQQIEGALLARYHEWLPARGLPSRRYVRPAQKQQEMELADLVLVPSSFVAGTVRQYTDKPVSLAPYGVDTIFWRPGVSRPTGPLRFLYAGQQSLRKGTPLLLQAWRCAELEDATLTLIGTWNLSEVRHRELPPHCEWSGPVGRDALRTRYQQSDVFVLPSYFEGRALVGGEAMACGLPLITTDASGVSDLVDDSSGRCLPAGNLDALVDALRWFSSNRNRLGPMRAQARLRAEQCTWEHYRECVAQAVSALAGGPAPLASQRRAVS